MNVPQNYNDTFAQTTYNISWSHLTFIKLIPLSAIYEPLKNTFSPALQQQIQTSHCTFGIETFRRQYLHSILCGPPTSTSACLRTQLLTASTQHRWIHPEPKWCYMNHRKCGRLGAHIVSPDGTLAPHLHITAATAATFRKRRLSESQGR